jgi:hypothetical protein
MQQRVMMRRRSRRMREVMRRKKRKRRWSIQKRSLRRVSRQISCPWK